MVTRTPRTPARAPRTAGPQNESRAAGAPVPASAAATAPTGRVDTAQAQRGEFYDPAAAAERPADAGAAGQGEAQGASGLAAFTERVRESHVALERGGSADVEVVEREAADALSTPEDLAAEIARIRKIRRPIGAYAQKLALPARQGYHRHWFNDVAGRIDEATANGWTHVLGADKKPIARCVGTGRDKGAMYAFAMEIPEIFWLEDQAARHQAASDRIEGLKKAPFRAEAGTAKPADRGKFYDPSEHEAGPLQVVKS